MYCQLECSLLHGEDFDAGQVCLRLVLRRGGKRGALQGLHALPPGICERAEADVRPLGFSSVLTLENEFFSGEKVWSCVSKSLL